MTHLTDRQEEFLRMIAAYQREHWRCPTYREIGLALGIKSPNGVAAHIKALVRKGALAKDNFTARGLSIPTTGCPHVSTDDGEVTLAWTSGVTITLSNDEASELARKLIDAGQPVTHSGV